MKVIPNQNCWVGFNASVANINSPALAEVTGAVNLTPFLISLTASSTGNTVPTPTLDSLFETNVPGTSTGQFSADFYRDDTNDLAWNTLPRNTFGYFIISRFGGTGANASPVHGQNVEVWPVRVVTRAGSQMTSNTAQTLTVTGSVPTQPAEGVAVN